MRRRAEGTMAFVLFLGLLTTLAVTGGVQGTAVSTPVNAAPIVGLSLRPTLPPSAPRGIASSTSKALSHDVVTAARCRVRCLSLLKMSIDVPLLSTVKEATSMVNCLRDADCTTCLKPCNQPLLSQDHCEDVCKFPKEDRICSESCKFLKEMKQTTVPGVCPSLTETNTSRGQDGCGGGTGGGRGCASDKSCDKDFKCCVTHCGMSCRRALLPVPVDLPAVPEVPVLKEKPRGGSVELKWNSVASNGTGPVLYIVDFRWNIGKRHSEDNMTTWQQVAQTTGTSAVINDITPGHWYQFRVSSISIHGSRGGSLPTQAFTLSKEPRKPGPPTNLTEGDTLIAGGRMTVTIRWFPPKKSDLPVTRYKLYWSKRLKPTTAQLLAGNRELRKVLPGNSLTYQIQNLDSDTTYIVQVQAICQYGEVRLKSEKASIYITTYPLPKPADQYGMPVDSAGTSRVHPTPSPVMALSVDKPFYDSGILKANVSWRIRHEEGNDLNGRKFLLHWSPEACIADSSISDDSLSRVMSSTTSENHFVIHDLRTDCRYLVKVESVSIQGIIGKAELISFSTPACGQVQATGKLQPDCLVNVPRVPEEPPDLVHTFLISNSNITSRLSWETPASESPISGYRVTWGPVLHSHRSNPVMDKASTFTKVLSKDVRSLSIGNLLEGMTYVVRVQAYSKFGHGQIASIQFATPLLQVAPVDQPYREVHGIDNKRQDVIKKKSNALTNSTHTTTTPTLRIDRKILRHPTPTASLASLTVDSFSVITTCLLVQSFVTFASFIPFGNAA